MSERISDLKFALKLIKRKYAFAIELRTPGGGIQTGTPLERETYIIAEQALLKDNLLEKQQEAKG